MIAKKIKKRKSYQTLFFSVLLGLLTLIVIGFLIISNWRINQKRTEYKARIEALEKEIQILEEKSKELESQISQASSETFLEKEAREKLGLKKPGEEVVVVLPPKESKEEKTKEEKHFWNPQGWWEWIRSKMRD